MIYSFSKITRQVRELLPDEYIQQAMSQKRIWGWIDEELEEEIGIILYSISEDYTSARLMYVYVDEMYRRIGYGEELLRASLRGLVMMGVVRIRAILPPSLLDENAKKVRGLLEKSFFANEETEYLMYSFDQINVSPIAALVKEHPEYIEDVHPLLVGGRNSEALSLEKQLREKGYYLPDKDKDRRISRYVMKDGSVAGILLGYFESEEEVVLNSLICLTTIRKDEAIRKLLLSLFRDLGYYLPRECMVRIDMGNEFARAFLLRQIGDGMKYKRDVYFLEIDA